MTALVRVTMPLTEMRQLMSAGFRSLMTLLSCRLNVFTCAQTTAGLLSRLPAPYSSFFAEAGM